MVCYFLCFIIILPFIFEADFILKIWLGNVPEYTVIFTRLILIDALLISFTYPLGAVNQASGNIGLYQVLIGGLLIADLPVTVVFFKFGASPEAAMIISICFSGLTLAVRLVIIKVQMGLSVLRYIRDALLPMMLVSAISMIIPLILYMNISNGIIGFFIICIASVLSSSLVMYILGLNNSEKKWIVQILKSRLLPKVGNSLWNK
jgi:hypothetical protein